MAKAHSPVRLEKTLMESATITGKLFNRSATQQVEHWAMIGRAMEHLVGIETLLDVMLGVKRISLVDESQVRVDPNAVFANIEQKRDAGQLTKPLKPGEIRYQASSSHPGLLEQITAECVLVGSFEGGVFKQVKVQAQSTR